MKNFIFAGRLFPKQLKMAKRMPGEPGFGSFIMWKCTSVKIEKLCRKRGCLGRKRRAEKGRESQFINFKWPHAGVSREASRCPGAGKCIQRSGARSAARKSPWPTDK